MSAGAIAGPAILPAGRIADPTGAEHTAPIFSTAKGQTTPNRLVTRRTPTNFGVCCLIDLVQRERAALMASMHYDEAAREVYAEPYHGADEADVPPRA